MGHTMSEKRVLKKLNIPDFRYLTKDHLMWVESNLHKMDKEVALKVLEQFPEFSNSMLTMVGHYKEVALKALESNNDSVRENYRLCSEVMDSLKAMLESSDLSFEEKHIVMDEMYKVAILAKEIDKQNKKWITALLAGLGTVLLTTAGIVVSSLGNSSKTSSDDIYQSDDEEDDEE